MKKIIVGFCLTFIIIANLIGNVLAANGKITLETTETEVSKKSQVVIQVKLSDIQASKGAVGFSATLEYDKESLTYEKMEGQSGWSNIPTYNEENGKLAMGKGGNITGTETILKITFRVKESAKQNLVVNLKNITFSEGIEDIKIPNSYIRLTVKEGTVNPKPDPTPTPDPDGDKPTTDGNNTIQNNNQANGEENLNVIGNQTTNQIGNNSGMANGNLPQAGKSNTAITVIIVGAFLISLILFIRMKVIHHKIGK